MKLARIIIAIMFSSMLICSNCYAGDFDQVYNEMWSDVTQKVLAAEVPANKKKDHYKTWTVEDVTADIIKLQRKKRDGEIDSVDIKRSRRPYLKVGDRVRYDKTRNRLRKTLDK